MYTYSRPWKVIHGDGIGGRARTLKDAIGKSHSGQQKGGKAPGANPQAQQQFYRVPVPSYVHKRREGRYRAIVASHKLLAARPGPSYRLDEIERLAREAAQGGPGLS